MPEYFTTYIIGDKLKLSYYSKLTDYVFLAISQTTKVDAEAGDFRHIELTGTNPDYLLISGLPKITSGMTVEQVFTFAPITIGRTANNGYSAIIVLPTDNQPNNNGIYKFNPDAGVYNVFAISADGLFGGGLVQKLSNMPDNLGKYGVSISSYNNSLIAFAQDQSVVLAELEYGGSTKSETHFTKVVQTIELSNFNAYVNCRCLNKTGTALVILGQDGTQPLSKIYYYVADKYEGSFRSFCAKGIISEMPSNMTRVFQAIPTESGNGILVAYANSDSSQNAIVLYLFDNEGNHYMAFYFETILAATNIQNGQALDVSQSGKRIVFVTVTKTDIDYYNLYYFNFYRGDGTNLNSKLTIENNTWVSETGFVEGQWKFLVQDLNPRLKDNIYHKEKNEGYTVNNVDSVIFTDETGKTVSLTYYFKSSAYRNNINVHYHPHHDVQIILGTDDDIDNGLNGPLLGPTLIK